MDDLTAAGPPLGAPEADEQQALCRARLGMGGALSQPLGRLGAHLV